MKKFNKKAFTLIELLIVIALLGALAVGLLAALDPFEQLKKGTDTGTRNIVSEVHGAIIRYYGVKSHMPWCALGTGETGCLGDPSGKNLTQVPIDTAIDNIIIAGELKNDFVELAGGTGGNMTKVYVTGVEDDATAIVCYKPTAKSFASDPNTKYTIAGVTPNGSCPTGDPTDDCYWCVK